MAGGRVVVCDRGIDVYSRPHGGQRRTRNCRVHYYELVEGEPSAPRPAGAQRSASEPEPVGATAAPVTPQQRHVAFRSTTPEPVRQEQQARPLPVRQSAPTVASLASSLPVSPTSPEAEKRQSQSLETPYVVAAVGQGSASGAVGTGDKRTALLRAVNTAIDELVEIGDQPTLDLVIVQVWGRHPEDWLGDEFDESGGGLSEDVVRARCSTQCLEAILQICKKALT